MFSEFVNRNQGLPVYKELEKLAERAKYRRHFGTTYNATTCPR